MKFDFSFKIFKKKVGKTIVIDDKKILKDMIGIDLDSLLNKIIDGAMKGITGILDSIFNSAFKPIESLFKNLLQGIARIFKLAINKLLVPIKWIGKNLKQFGTIMNNIFRNFINLLKPVFKIFTGFFQSIGKIMSKAFQKFAQIMKAFGKIFVKAFATIGKFLMKIFKTIGAFFEKLFAELIKVFELIFFYIVCAWNKIMVFHRCILYYSIDVIIFTCLLPIRMLFWMIPQLQMLEDIARDALELLDGMVYDFTLSALGKGIHINQWPNDVMNRCYRCKPKEEKIEKGLFLKELEEFFSNKNNFFHFAFRCTLIIFSFIALGIIIYRMFIKKGCNTRQ